MPDEKNQAPQMVPKTKVKITEYSHGLITLTVNGRAWRARTNVETPIADQDLDWVLPNLEASSAKWEFVGDPPAGWEEKIRRDAVTNIDTLGGQPDPKDDLEGVQDGPVTASPILEQPRVQEGQQEREGGGAPPRRPDTGRPGDDGGKVNDGGGPGVEQDAKASLLDGSVSQVTDALPLKSDEELEALAAEEGGKRKRKGILAAIKAEQVRRANEQQPQ